MLRYSVHSRLREFHLRRLANGLPRDAVFLDVGCGMGYLTRILRKDYKMCIGIDTDEVGLRANLRAGVGCMIKGEAHQLAIVDNSIDLVLCSEVLEHLPEPRDAQALAELVRVTRPGGRILITVPALEGLRATTRLRNLGHDDPSGGEYHYRPGYTFERLREMVAAAPGARIKSLRFSMFLLSELFMDLLKLVYLGKKKLKEQSDITATPKGILFRAYKIVFPLLNLIFLAEDMLMCPLFKGHIMILEVEKLTNG